MCVFFPKGAFISTRWLVVLGEGSWFVLTVVSNRLVCRVRSIKKKKKKRCSFGAALFDSE